MKSKTWKTDVKSIAAAISLPTGQARVYSLQFASKIDWEPIRMQSKKALLITGLDEEGIHSMLESGPTRFLILKAEMAAHGFTACPVIVFASEFPRLQGSKVDLDDW